MRARRLVLGLAAAAVTLATPARGQNPADPPSGTPLLETSDLAYAGILLGSFVAIWPLQSVDESLRPGQPPTGFANTFYEVGATVGSLATLGVASAGAFGAGKLFGSESLARIGLRSLEALLVTEVIVQPLKVVVGRRRPVDDEARSTEFDPFSFDTGSQSFPSGHSAQAFAVASVLSLELADDAPWVPFVAYPVAGLVGISRVVGQKHWATDVVAGSAVGLFAGHVVERWNRRRELRGATAFRPVFVAGGGMVYAGVRVSLR